jgi:hypothetical protein
MHLCKICKSQIQSGLKCDKCKDSKTRVKAKKVEIVVEQTSFNFEKDKMENV